jgi:hypothetical protein
MDLVAKPSQSFPGQNNHNLQYRNISQFSYARFSDFDICQTYNQKFSEILIVCLFCQLLSYWHLMRIFTI